MSVQDAPFVPTVTAISSTPDFQWMVQPTIMTSVSPSLGGKQANEPHSSQQATPKEGGNKGRNTVKKGKTEQVGVLRSCLPAVAQNSRSAYASLSPAHTHTHHWCRAPAAFLRHSLYMQVTASLQQRSIFRRNAGKHAFAIFQRVYWGRI